MDEAIRLEFERLRDEDKRLNERVKILEANSKSMQQLSESVHILANDMKRMLEEQEKQGERIGKLEAEPAQNWKTLKTTIITGIASALAGGVATALIFILSNTP